MSSEAVPIRAVEEPILCSPYEAPNKHWRYDRTTGRATPETARRPSRYWYKTKDDAKGQYTLELSEGQDDLAVVNQLREDVARWRDSNYEGVTPVTRELLTFWKSSDRPRRLFFCQLEAVETVVYLSEILRSGRRPRFNPEFTPGSLSRLNDQPANPDLLPLTRLGCKMATGSGKTVVMSMLIAWSFCNRGRNPSDERFPNAVLVCCPNLTVKERLQVLRPENPANYYAAFDIVPVRLRPLLQSGRVLIENWHSFAPASEHAEGGKSHAVVNKGVESPDAFARRVLGDLYDRMPVMVLNDEAHHCYRPAPLSAEARKGMSAEELKAAQAENEEATVWIDGLDTINNYQNDAKAKQVKPGVAMCVDLSATPFYISGSGHTEGSPFPWLVSDFGLMDAIESGIVKIPRLPVSDTTGKAEPEYFNLWKNIKNKCEPADILPGKAGKPKPNVVYAKAEAALKQLAGHWVEKFLQNQAAQPGQHIVPPVLIIVCDNTDIAEYFYTKISGEEKINMATQADADAEDSDEEESESTRSKGKKRGSDISFGHGAIFKEYFENTKDTKHTIRIDSELLASAESGDPDQSRKKSAELLRQVVATVGKKGEPGEHVRCVVSVSMLTEGWDANNVTHIFGLRAFLSQLLCEQVVGRGLRRMNYDINPETGRLDPEYVDVYGIPFSIVPFKGRQVDKVDDEGKPKNHVKALPERAHLEIRFPVVEGFAFALKRNQITCDVASMQTLDIEPGTQPTATFIMPTVGYQQGHASQNAPFGYVLNDRANYYKTTHLQLIAFQISRLVVHHIASAAASGTDAKSRVLQLQSRHVLFPQVLKFVTKYIRTKVNWNGADPRELGLQQYAQRVVELMTQAITPDTSEGEPPLLPVLNRYKPFGTSEEVDFLTTRPCRGTQKSHVNQVVVDTDTWESSVAFYLEQSPAVDCYVRNDHLGLLIAYEFDGVDHNYEPDFIVRLSNGTCVILEVKGYEDQKTRAKHQAAKRWVQAVNNAQEHGRWEFIVCKNPHDIPKMLDQVNSTK